MYNKASARWENYPQGETFLPVGSIWGQEMLSNQIVAELTTLIRHTNIPNPFIKQNKLIQTKHDKTKYIINLDLKLNSKQFMIQKRKII